MDNMIGYPDNIRLSDHGTFLVGITTTRFRKLMPPFLDTIAPYPAIKRFLAKVGVLHSLTTSSMVSTSDHYDIWRDRNKHILQNQEKYRNFKTEKQHFHFKSA